MHDIHCPNKFSGNLDLHATLSLVALWVAPDPQMEDTVRKTVANAVALATVTGGRIKVHDIPQSRVTGRHKLGMRVAGQTSVSRLLSGRPTELSGSSLPGRQCKPTPQPWEFLFQIKRTTAMPSAVCLEKW